MGIPFFSTFIDQFLFSTTRHLKHVNLTNKNVIIDGNSFLYFLYDEIRVEDSSKSMAQRVTATQFGYDGCWAKFRTAFRQFKDKCASVHVVFDGFSKLKDHKRFDPERASSVRFDDDSNSPPSLIREELTHILHQLQIPVHVAPGEADPMIVQMARERDAYIVARDVDYHLYELSQGYVPLHHLTRETLEGRLYHMADIFQGLNQRSVALWATIIAFEFVDFDVLEKEFPSTTITTAKDKKEFHKWLKDIISDNEKHRWLTCQWNLLRYIQQVGEMKAFDKLTKLVSAERRPLFDELIESYVTVSNETPIRTRNHNQIPHYLHIFYVRGELDRAVIKILVTGEVLPHWQGTHSAHIRLLLPMCHILLKWDYQKEQTVLQNPTVTFKGQQYHPFELVQPENLPLLAEFPHREKIRQKAFVLGCVDFALELRSNINWRGIQNNYLLWLSLLKLWFHTRETTMPLREPILLAMIVSFLKHVLLDTYNETKERTPKGKELPSKPFLRYCTQYLKSYFSLDDCIHLRASIEQHPTSLLPNDDIEMQLVEAEQFYKELTMVNQFCGRPFDMPPPHQCVSQLTRQLAVVFKTSKDIGQDIPILFNHNKILIELTKEICALILLNVE